MIQLTTRLSYFVALTIGTLTIVIGCSLPRADRDPRIIAWTGYLKTRMELVVMERDGLSINFDDEVLIENRRFFTELIELGELVAIKYDSNPDSVSSKLVDEFTVSYRVFGESIPTFVGGNTLLGAQNPPGAIYIMPDDFNRLPAYLRERNIGLINGENLDMPTPSMPNDLPKSDEP